MDSTEYVELLAKEARLEGNGLATFEELDKVSRRLYEIQQEMLRHYGSNAGSIVAEALVP